MGAWLTNHAIEVSIFFLILTGGFGSIAFEFEVGQDIGLNNRDFLHVGKAKSCPAKYILTGFVFSFSWFSEDLE